MKKQKGFVPMSIIILLAILTIATGGVVMRREKTTPKQKPTPIPTSIPTFVPEITLSPQPTSISKNGCRVGGCNGELCLDENNEARNAICVEPPWHHCFHTATCERQTDGLCAWTQTAELKDCLNKFRN